MQRKNPGFYEQVEAVLTSAQFGDLASDHRAELEGYHGWNWAAITAVCRQVARAVAYVFDDSDPAMANKRKIARSQGDYLKALSNEHQGQILPNSHGLVKLLMRPNPSQRMDMFNWERVQQLRLHGSCIIWERPNAGGITCQRYVIPRLLAVPVKPGQHRSCPNGGVYLSPRAFAAFATTAMDEQGFVESPIRSFVGGYIPVEDLSFPKYPHPYYKGDGSSPTYAGSMWIDSLTGVDKTRMDLYRQGPFGKILIKCASEDPKVIADLQAVINRAFADESAPVVVIGNGESTLAELTADKMVFVENHDQLADAILGTHGIGRALVGKQDGMTYGSLAAAIKGAIALSIQSDMDLLAGYDTIQLCDEWGQNLTIEYEVPPIDDPELQEQMLAADSTKGVMTVGEYRQRRRMPLFGNEYDNYLMTPQGAVPMSQLLKASQPPAPAPALSSIVPQPAEQQPEPKDLTLAVDPTLIERVTPKFLDALSKSGVRLVDVEEEADHCWDWSIGPDQDKLIKSLPSHVADQINKQLGKEYKYGCVMLPLKNDLAKLFLEMGAAIPDDMLDVGGREDDPHVTLLYGITGCDPETVVAAVHKMRQPEITFGIQSVFPAGSDGVPVKVEIDSPALVALNQKLKDVLPHVVTHPIYNPHATIAYVKPEYASRFDQKQTVITRSTTVLTHAIVSMPGCEKIVVPLRQDYRENRDSVSVPSLALVERQHSIVTKDRLENSISAATEQAIKNIESSAELLCETVQSKLFEIGSLAPAGLKGWVTIEDSGTRIYIDDSGTVTAGPPALEGRRAGDWSGPKPSSGGGSNPGKKPNKKPESKPQAKPTSKPSGNQSEPKPENNPAIADDAQQVKPPDQVQPEPPKPAESKPDSTKPPAKKPAATKPAGDKPAPQKAKPFKNGNEAESKLGAAGEQWHNSLTYEQQAGLKGYAGTSDSFQINRQLRDGKFTNPRHKETAKRLESALDQASFPEDATVFRSINANSPEERAAILSKFESSIGKSVADKSFVSTTANKKYAETWGKNAKAKPIEVEVMVKKGAKAQYLSKTVVGRQEWEILIQRNSKFKVHSVVDGKVTLELE